MDERSVDLSNLRMATDGDKELEKELFDEFITSSAELIGTLEEHARSMNDNETWRSVSHALKGICANLGAANLADICKESQEACNAPLPDKQDILARIKQEHEKVVQFLQSESA